MVKLRVNSALKVVPTPSDNYLIRIEGFNFDYRRTERRVKAPSAQPVEQTAARAPSPASANMPRAPPKFSAAMTENAMKTPAPSAATAATEEDIPMATTTSLEPSQSNELTAPSATHQQAEVKPPPPTASPSTSTRQQGPGKPNSQIWIGDPPADPRDLFAPQHREKIREYRSQTSKIGQHYAIVYFYTVEDATAALESVDMSSGLKVRYGNDFQDRPHYSRSGGGDSFSGRGSYDTRKSMSSVDSENRGGVGRGGRGGRGGGGSISSRGSGGPGTFGGGRGSPAPRGRGGARGVTSRDSGEHAADSSWGGGDDGKHTSDENKATTPAVAPSSSGPGGGQAAAVGGPTAASTPAAQSSGAAGESHSQSS